MPEGGRVERNIFDLAGIEAYFRMVEAWNPLNVVPTPWPTINRRCGGFGGGVGMALGWYLVFGGSTGAGKSLAALNMAHYAITNGHNVGFVTLEMSPEQLMTRLYAMMFGVEVRRIEPGKWFDPQEAERLKAAVDEAKAERPAMQFRVNERKLRSLPYVLELMQVWHDEWGLEVFVVDYIQLCRVPDEDQTHRRIQAVSEKMCDFAHENECLVLGLSQFHAVGRRDKSAPPTVDSLYGGVDLGNDADMCLILDHSRYLRYGDHDEFARTWLCHAKQREGPTGDAVPVLWDYRTLTVREAMPDEEYLWPGVE